MADGLFTIENNDDMKIKVDYSNDIEVVGIKSWMAKSKVKIFARFK